MSHLRDRTIIGLVWTIVERLSVQLVQFIVTLILARILDPSDFGLIGMIAIFVAIGQTILDSGFGTALIQKQDASQVDASSIFFLNLILGFSLAFILYLIAPFISSFYNQPKLVEITRFSALNLIFVSFSAVHTSLLTKAMNFKPQLIANSIATLTSGAIGILIAIKGGGVWSLAFQIVSISFIRTLILWKTSKWRPTFEFSLSSLRTMYGFGSKLLASGLLNAIFRNIYITAIGKFYTTSALGFYTQANSLASAIMLTTTTSIAKVTLPAFSPLQDNDSILKSAYRKTIRLTNFIHFPILLGLVAVAADLFTVLFTAKWNNSVPYFQLLCLAGLLSPVQVLNSNIFWVKGKTNIFLRLEIIYKFLIVIAIILTINHGIKMVIIGQIITSVISFFLYSTASGKIIGYSSREQILDILQPLFSSMFMFSVIYFMQKLPITDSITRLILQISTGTLVYFLINKLIKSEDLGELTKVLQGFLKQIRKNI